MKTIDILSALILISLTTFLAAAYDPSPLQDFCVAVNNATNGLFVNGKFCKDPNLVTANDFFYQGLNNSKPTSPPFGYTETTVDVDKLPGLNTMGISIAQGLFAPNGGLKGPHVHPRASEVFTVLEGSLFAGFVSSNGTFYGKMLKAGDVFVFPMGLIHFQYNNGSTPAIGLGALNSQNGGLVTVGNTVFGANPPINANILAGAFQLNVSTVEELQAKSWPSN